MLDTICTAQSDIVEAYRFVRDRSLKLIAPLSAEDTVVQSMPDVSPTKWHLAHSSWFFEQFLLSSQCGYEPLRPGWQFLFNSYYESVGPRHNRVQRGLLSRPTLAEVIEYRHRVDDDMAPVLDRAASDPELAALINLGLHHEQQHQELMLTDIKHVFSVNPLEPSYQREAPFGLPGHALPMRFVRGSAGIVEIGHHGEGFAFDCETPRHRTLLHPYEMADRPVTNDEFRDFIRDGGYRTPSLWMSEGWARAQAEAWAGPMYWDAQAETEFTLAGRREIDPYAPVCHVSYYEADAYARWAGARLPRESEWEHLTETRVDVDAQLRAANFADAGFLHPQPAQRDEGLLQLFGDVWEWTSSPYVNYPGYKPLPGALGEYNGKFMCGQWVLRGGSCVTPVGHLRASYRNFFYPPDRWQFMGFRLAKDA
ncbi:ergothioneine biosynthesis protein EgtB [Algiphilus sp. W345]|uniref:Ergothioneine biosynthesis protein EgtB n=1 Tax=Banduia mediterranea TaxID=3075609 RepID=A0ABU2WIK3_9GAMM|nr:ergothioneine biosynthesis protein EgtB [Algiphilus sp. W345]MDT0496902.1 ergothioneine biosynthesis protein EgtB [Algiphilus sp. W345]